MTYYRDLTRYRFIRGIGVKGALNVGWLEFGRPFKKGDVPELFMAKLVELCLNHHMNITRGLHCCTICALGEETKSPRTTPLQTHARTVPLRSATIIVGGKPRTVAPLALEAGGKRVLLGCGEVWVRGIDGVWYATPTLILHYVQAHRYAPPKEFIQAVLSGRPVSKSEVEKPVSSVAGNE